MKPEKTGHPISTHIGTRGTVVIPASLRRKLGLEDGTRVTVEQSDGGVLIRPAPYVELGEEEREALLEAANRAYAALRADPEAWAADRAERALWEGLAGETLPAESWADWFEDGETAGDQ